MAKLEGYCPICRGTLLKTNPGCEYHRLAAHEELGERLAEAILAALTTHDGGPVVLRPSSAQNQEMAKLAREFKEWCNSE